jgi:hypothetical protein
MTGYKDVGQAFAWQTRFTAGPDILQFEVSDTLTVVQKNAWPMDRR